MESLFKHCFMTERDKTSTEIVNFEVAQCQGET